MDLDPFIWESTFLDLTGFESTVQASTISSDRFWIWGPIHLLGVDSLGVFNVERPMLDLGTHSLGIQSTVWEFALWESRV